MFFVLTLLFLSYVYDYLITYLGITSKTYSKRDIAGTLTNMLTISNLLAVITFPCM